MTAEVRSIDKRLTPHALLAMLFNRHAEIKNLGVVVELKEGSGMAVPYMTAFTHDTSAIDACFYLRLLEKCYEESFDYEYVRNDHI